MIRTERIRVRGIVQGVGFRPAVWRIARMAGVRGTVRNDGEGVLILAQASAETLDAFLAALQAQAPPLARIDRIEREAAPGTPPLDDFAIVDSRRGGVRTGVAPDAASCAECVREVLDPAERRHRYAFTNCTHCGPRLSIIESVPYDRAATTMRSFELCPACEAQYRDPSDRRFHAQPIACPDCGPHAWLERAEGARVTPQTLGALDALDAVRALIGDGQVVAIKGIGGFQLACDAHDEAAVARLRAAKRRERKPFALMARDCDVIRRYARLSESERRLLESPEAPIVILDAAGPARVASGVAPGLASLGFMLPNSPLHHLIWQCIDRAVVLTSGNLADEPQCIENGDARARLCGAARFFLMHQRGIARRVDDSLARLAAGEPRILRRARGYAPAAIPLPPGFEATPALLAMGADSKNSFCLVRDGAAIVSHHIGDLDDAATLVECERNLEDYLSLFAHRPERVAIDLHPDFRSARLGRERAARDRLPLVPVQHHHAHVAACMAENSVALDAGPVLGVALDGLGCGERGALWGGEFLLADYRGFRRLATFRPVAMPGGEAAVREPWRNAYAQLKSALGWERFAAEFGALELWRYFEAKPRAVLDAMIEGGLNSPKASSCGRLFDAVAAAVGVCRDRAWYEGQAAAELEALVDRDAFECLPQAEAYPLGIARDAESGLACIDSAALWFALLADLRDEVGPASIAARFHAGLAAAVARMVDALQPVAGGTRTVALSGGVFQNRVLLEALMQRLKVAGFRVLTHRQVPCGDGGISLGQAAIAAARALRGSGSALTPD